MSMPFYTKLREARTRLAYTQAAMARGSGVSQPDLSDLETQDKKLIPLRYLVYLHKRGIDLNTLFAKGPVSLQQETYGRATPEQATDTGLVFITTAQAERLVHILKMVERDAQPITSTLEDTGELQRYRKQNYQLVNKLLGL